MLGRVDEVELLTALHAGVHEMPQWQTFLERLRRRMRAGHCWLIIGSDDPDIRERHWLVAAPGLSADATSGSIPGAIRAARQRPDRIYTGNDLADLLPEPIPRLELSGKYLRTIRVISPGVLSGWIAVARSGEDFSAADGAVLTALVPHLAIALQTMAALDDLRGRVTLGEAVLQRAGLGWAWVENDGALGSASPVARHILADGGAYLQSDSADAVRRLIDAPTTNSDRSTDRCTAVRSPTPDIGLRKVGFPPIEQPASDAMLLIVRGPPAEHCEQIELLAQQFKLTRTEAKLALLLARNLSIAEAAAALGLTVDTARNYSKRLYFKTTTRGLSELVRRVLLSVAILG